MSKYFVHHNDGQIEEITASRHIDNKDWLVFQQDDAQGVATEILRLKAADVRRVELIPDESDKA